MTKIFGILTDTMYDYSDDGIHIIVSVSGKVEEDAVTGFHLTVTVHVNGTETIDELNQKIIQSIQDRVFEEYNITVDASDIITTKFT